MENGEKLFDTYLKHKEIAEVAVWHILKKI